MKYTLLALSMCIGCGSSYLSGPVAFTLVQISHMADHRGNLNKLSEWAVHDIAAIRAGAVLALGQNEDRGALPVLKQRIADVDPKVRRNAVFALGQIGAAESEQWLLVRLKVEKHPLIRREIWAALGRFGTDASLQATLSASGLDQPVGLANAGLILRRLGRSAADVPALVDALSNDNPETRAAALYAFHRNKTAPDLNARTAAVKALESESGSERESAVRVLSHGVAEVEDALSNALQSNTLSPHQLAAVVRGLAKTKSSQASALLVHLLSKTITDMSNSRRMLHPRYHVALHSARTLRRREITEKHRALLPELAQLAAAHEKADPMTVQRRRRMLLCALSQIQNERQDCTPREIAAWSNDSAELTTLTAHREAGVRMAALTSLARIKQGAETIAAALDDRDLPVMATAASLLADQKAALPTRKWLGAWSRAMESGDLEVAGDILRAMTQLKVPAESAYNEALASNSAALRKLAVKGIKALTGREPLPLRRTEAQPKPLSKSYSPRRNAVATIKTELGEIVIDLHSHIAPLTVNNFAALAERGYFNGLNFHRVVPDFVIQGGDPRGDGWGGPGHTIRCENNPLPYRTGTVGMALAGKDTGGSQWFITHSAQPHLLGTYTVFGQVKSGQEIVDTIVEGDRILSIELR